MRSIELKNLRKVIENCEKHLNSLKDKEVEAILDKDRYINKYVRIKDIGCMYIEDITLKKENSLSVISYKAILWGAYYGYEVGTYLDENWARWGLYTSISLPINNMEDKISIISKKEYINGFNNMIDKIKRENNRYLK